MDRQISIFGKTYSVVRVSSSNRGASARLRGTEIIISIPSRWPRGEAERIAVKLEEKAIRNLERGRWGTREMRRIEFSHGQEFDILGRRFRITDPADHERIRKGITRRVLPDIEHRVRSLNESHFRSEIKKISLRDNTTRWGSYSPKGTVNLNFRLLFAPPEILDYVIIHELAHSRYRSHGQRFWTVVEGIMPDHKAKRRWLKENGHKLGPGLRLTGPNEEK